MSSAADRAIVAPRGATVFDRYRISARLHADARGECYLGEDLDSRVAVEVRLLSHPAFRGEASRLWDAIGPGIERVASVDHPGVERVVCAGVAEFEQEPLVCVVAEHVKGVTLQSCLRERGRLSPAEVISVGVQIVSGLAALHDHDILHGDLRPSRVALTPSFEDGVAVLCDVGTNNLLLGALRDSPALLEIFSPEYVAPEQIEGDLATAATDVYALGLVLYRLLTGASPYRVESMRELLIAQLATAPLPMRERGADANLPSPVEALVARCLAKRPKDRFESAHDLLDALRRCEEIVGPPTYFHSSDFASPHDDRHPSRPTPTASGITPANVDRALRSAASHLRGATLPALRNPPLPVAAPPLAPPPITEETATAEAIAAHAIINPPPARPTSPLATRQGLVGAAILMLGAGLLTGLVVSTWRRPASLTVSTRAASPAATSSVRLLVRSSTAGAEVIVRGRRFAAPMQLDLAAGNAPEMVEVTAPGFAARRLWMMLDCNTEAQIDLTDAEAQTPAPTAPTAPSTGAPLTSAIVRDVVAQHEPEVENCRNRARVRNPTMHGRVRVTVVIGPNGNVRRASWTDHEPDQLQALGCITSAMRRWTFPASNYGGDFLSVQTFSLD
jgi:serine/threonine protein kinase